MAPVRPLPRADAMLARRRRGIVRAGAAWGVLAVGSYVVWRETGFLAAWALVWIFASGVAHTVLRAWRTWRLGSLVRGRGPCRTVHVTRHWEYRYKLPALYVAGLWPQDAPAGETPPLSVRVEELRELPEGGEVVACGELRPGGRVLLVHDGEIVWPTRRVREGLHPPYVTRYRGW